ncbi:hypothetical protein GCM10009682_44450 [Luedemannella flava]|uniref:DUF4333 domain-containing protein n=1 Tax=Luedemannella flava TaxID=349316 RepID=A0ABN2MCH4_9ACTN
MGGPTRVTVVSRPARGVAVVVAVMVTAVVTGCSARPPVSPDLVRAAGERALPLVEKGPGARFLEPGQQLRCVVRAFGVEPADATAIDQVTVVYAGATCVVVAPGVPYDRSTGSQAPVVVHLDTGVVEQPGDGAQFSADIDRMFPEELRDRAADPVPNSDDAAVDAELRSRFAQAQATPH